MSPRKRLYFNVGSWSFSHFIKLFG